MKKNCKSLQKYANKLCNFLILFLNIGFILYSLFVKNMHLLLCCLICLVLENYNLIVRLLFKVRINKYLQILTSITVFLALDIFVGFRCASNSIFALILQIAIDIGVYCYALVIFYNVYIISNRVKTKKSIKKIKKAYEKIPQSLKKMYAASVTITVLTVCIIIRYFCSLTKPYALTSYQIVFHIVVNIGLVFCIYLVHSLINFIKKGKIKERKLLEESNNIEIIQNVENESEKIQDEV